ncbi:hypothetical protein DQ04_18651000 [Trypanosoma grayi]|uniref:hypothetical protein n=1 Tax=Trypanosoma grayi TaxID=71804 RepID=UPI0004F466C6|nr:hypothetical protein DQ04_18651000 [Trypanosoma grayi]KEG05762.1 hypothetical protein DQ04_18651000 [Trypanosoma grayi]
MNSRTSSTTKDGQAHASFVGHKTVVGDDGGVLAGSVVFDLSSPFIAHPEQYHATTRAGDGIRVAEFFKHLRLITLDENWLRYHLAEVLLLRLPFLIFVFMATAMLVAGSSARCNAFWTFWAEKPPPPVHLRYIGETRPFCGDATMLTIDDLLYGRLVLFAALSGGFFVGPLVFLVPAGVLLCSWWEQRRCLRINAQLARVVLDDGDNNNNNGGRRRRAAAAADADADAAATSQLRGTMDLITPLLDGAAAEEGGTTGRVLPTEALVADGAAATALTKNAALGGLAGVQFFLATQRSGQAANAPHAISCRAASATGMNSTMRQRGRHCYATYLAPLVPSQYERQFSRGRLQQQRVRASKALQQLGLRMRAACGVAVEVLSLLLGLLAWVGAWRAGVALADQYGIWST